MINLTQTANSQWKVTICIEKTASSLPSKQLKLPSPYSTIEALAIESTFGKHEVASTWPLGRPKLRGLTTILDWRIN